MATIEMRAAAWFAPHLNVADAYQVLRCSSSEFDFGYPGAAESFEHGRTVNVVFGTTQACSIGSSAASADAAGHAPLADVPDESTQSGSARVTPWFPTSLQPRDQGGAGWRSA